MKNFLLGLFILIGLRGLSQTVTYTPYLQSVQYNYVKFDSGFLAPLRDTNVTRGLRRIGELRARPGDSLLYSWTGRKWEKLGGITDTISLSNRINLKLNKSDSTIYYPYSSNPKGYAQTGFIYPEDFGAVGDGITDDYAAIQAAINATPRRGTIYFNPNKTYIVNSTLSRSVYPINIVGGGGKYGGATLKMTVANDTLLAITVPEGTVLSQQDSASTIENIRIEGPTGNTSGSGVYSFTSVQGKYFSIYGFYNGFVQGNGGYYGHFENCKFALATNAGFFSNVEYIYNYNFANCNFDSNGFGVWMRSNSADGQRLSFHGGTVERNTIAGLYIDGMKAVNISNIYFETPTASAKNIFIGETLTTRNVKIESCWFTNYPSVAVWHIDLNRVINITIEECTLNGSAEGGGDIRGTANTTGVILINNTYTTLSGLATATIFKDNKIGIRTNNPQYDIQVGNSTDDVPHVIDVNAPLTALVEYSWSKAGSQKWQAYVPGNSNDLRFFDTQDRLTLKQGGGVGVGTTNPLYTFQVRPAPDKNFQFRSNVYTTSDGVLLQAANDVDGALKSLEFGGSLFSFHGGNSLFGYTTDDGVNKVQVNGSLKAATIYGGTAASSNLTLSSTSNATKGSVKLLGNNAYGASIPTSGSGQPALGITGRFNVINGNRTFYFDVVLTPAPYAELATYKYDDGTTFPLAFQTNGGNSLFGTSTDDGINKVQVSGYVKATGFRIPSGTSSQYLMADGSVSTGGGGITSLSAIGSTPNANAATITGSVLNLEPASQSFGGVVTAGAQTLGGDKTFSGNITAANLASGTYTPTISNTNNVSSSTAYVCQYLRVGNTVTVSGQVDVSPTAANTLTSFRLTLPIASTFTASEKAGGTGRFQNGSANGGASIAAVSGTQNVDFLLYPPTLALEQITFSFTYLIQ